MAPISTTLAAIVKDRGTAHRPRHPPQANSMFKTLSSASAPRRPAFRPAQREVPTPTARWLAFPFRRLAVPRNETPSCEFGVGGRRRCQTMRALVADSQRSSSDPRLQKASAATDSQRRRSRTLHRERGWSRAARLGSPSNCLAGSAERGFRHAQPNQYRRQLQSGNPAGNRQTIARISAGKPSTAGEPQKAGCSAL